MDIRVLFAPVFATCVLGMVIAFAAWARPGARERWLMWPWAFGGVAIVVLAFLSSRIGLGPARWVNVDAALRALGVVGLVAAGIIGWWASRQRKQGEGLLSSSPRALEEAVTEVRRDGGAVRGVFAGRIVSEEEVTSPGGVVCAFYEAQVRQTTGDGRKGTLLSTERAASNVMWLRGERVQALVSFSLESAHAVEEVRKCTFTSRLAMNGDHALADGDGATEATSFEKVGRKGEKCLVLGELRPGPKPGSYIVRGLTSGAATVILSGDAMPLARAILRKAWMAYAASAVLTLLAAWLLTR